ncbi:hypothetical protein AB9F43_15660 [Rhizobium leguminosarum]|uniref:hypothetical protein n=1 Tax=Rhizobium leguminosarum TaxID=384 RepID=UPI003F9A8307
MIAITLVVLSLTVGFAAGGAFLKGCKAINDAPFGCAEYLLFRYQTLITGLFALAGATLLWIQIVDQRGQAREQRRQRGIATRIRLPHALSKLMIYWEYCFSVWLSEDISKKNREPPYDALEAIMTAAPDADPATFESIQELIVLSQAFEARIRPHRFLRKSQRLNLMVVDIGRLTYLTTALFEYGRLEADTAPYAKPSRRELTEQLVRYMVPGKESKVLQRIEVAMDSEFGRRRTDEADEDIEDLT